MIVPSIGGPTVTVQSSTNVSCYGLSDGSASIIATGATSPYSYVWSPSGGNASNASNLSAGTYNVAVTDADGCVGTVSLIISSPPQIVVTESITNSNCTFSNGQISTTVTGGSGVYTYLWSNGQTTSSINNLSGGSYTLQVTSNSCSVTETYIIQSIGTLPITATPSTATVIEGTSVQLNAYGATSYSWTPTFGLSCTTCSNPIATPTSTTIYTVTGTDAFGCIGSADVMIIVETNCNDIFVPTVFAPSDGGPVENNTLCIFGNCIAELNYSVYNRWGELVFNTTDLSICWDGTYKDKPLNAGVFAYKLVVTLFDGTRILDSGNVTLVR